MDNKSPWQAFKLAFEQGQWNPFYTGLIVGLILATILFELYPK